METVTLTKIGGKVEIRSNGFDKYVKDWAKYFDGKWNGSFWTIDAKWEEKFCMKMRGDREVVYTGTEVEYEGAKQ